MKTSANLHRLQKFSANTAVWLFVRDPNTLDEIEREDLAAFCQASPILKRAYHLIQEFLSMLRKREGHRLDAWLEQIALSDLPELQQFAAGVEKDKAAVRAGLSCSINNGMVEGHVTKLKLIKRQMYGRAGFPEARANASCMRCSLRPCRILMHVWEEELHELVCNHGFATATEPCMTRLRLAR